MNILCIDLKSFYASVECVLRGLNPEIIDLAVVDSSRGPGSIVLAITPSLKNKGVKSRCRLYDLPKKANIIYAKPRMQTYIDYACKVYNLYLKYLSSEDIYVYSIDEAFLDISKYLNYYHCDVQTLALTLLKDIHQSIGLKASCGIGDNMFQAKVALDCFAKVAENGLGILSNENFIAKTKNIKPLNKIWGIGSQIEKRLASLQMYSFSDILEAKPQTLIDNLGIIGSEIYEHAQGIDTSTIAEVKNYKTANKSLGYSQILFEDYSYLDAFIIIKEYIELLSAELLVMKKQCQVISLSIAYSKRFNKRFSHQVKLVSPSNNRSVLLEAISSLYDKYIEDLPIRSISIRLSSLVNEEFSQNDLFSSSSKQIKENTVIKTLYLLQQKFGQNTINMANSYLPQATKIKRSNLIGGHNA